MFETTATTTGEIERAIRGRVPRTGVKVLARAIANATCHRCHRHIASDEIRAGGIHTYHALCRDVGMLEERVQKAEARTPAAKRRLADAKIALRRARASRV